MLFEAGGRFRGLDLDAFEVFDIPERERRRRAIVEGFHGALSALGEDLVDTLGAPLHAHLPRLDWPKTYQPFCTWLALSRLAHGYQGEAQLNVGVHRDHVAARYAWDASADSFGRFEFRARHGGLGETLADLARALGLRFRVYAAAPWPEGSRLVYESESDWGEAFHETARRGVWWEVGARWDLPGSEAVVGTPELGREAARIFRELEPLLD